jgi:hypothetical protein
MSNSALLSTLDNLEWAAPLDAEERAEMREELAPLLHAALITGDWLPYQCAFEAWRATAAVLSDPALTARLAEPGDPSEEVQLVRP